MKKEDKGSVIEQLSETLKTYSHFYLTDIEALNATKTSSLRRACSKHNIKMMVVKNTLFKKALENMETDYSALYGSLAGNTAIMFSDVVNAPARLIKDFTKDIRRGEIAKPQLKAAYVQESFYIGSEYLDALINVKSREEMIADLVALLQSPVKNVISALQSSGGHAIHGILQTLEER
jgi:large subunit ribosomal protein L10